MEQQRQPILSVNKVCKNFPGVRALDHVDFCVYPGEVHALIGENGAGKSTLMKIILGSYSMTSGSMLFKGEPYAPASPHEALQKGVSMIHQEISLIPFPFIIAVIMMLLVAILLNKTLYGRHLLAAGGNAEAANVSGIRVNKVKISAHVIAGAIYGVAAIVLTGRVGNAIPTAGDGYMMDAISAVVIGGTPMHGGKAKVVGTLFGVLLIGIMNNMLNLLRVDTFYQWIFKGIILIAAILLDGMTEAVMAKQRVAIQTISKQ